MAEKHYNPVIYQQLKGMIIAEQWKEMEKYLSGLSNSDYRTAGYVIGESIFRELRGPAFWVAFVNVVEINPKAFLVTLLKAVIWAYSQGTIKMENTVFSTYAHKLLKEQRGIDKTKIINKLLPLLKSPKEIEYLLSVFGEETPALQLPHLLQCHSTPAYYVLFNALKKADDEKMLLTQCCLQLMKKGDDKSFNLAGIIKSYFDLSEVNSVFSLKINPHELSYLDLSYESFKKVLQSI
ncbi:MAG: hypothetical protein RR280_00575 [Bacteroidaceae bacterium]